MIHHVCAAMQSTLYGVRHLFSHFLRLAVIGQSGEALGRRCLNLCCHSSGLTK